MDYAAKVLQAEWLDGANAPVGHLLANAGQISDKRTRVPIVALRVAPEAADDLPCQRILLRKQLRSLPITPEILRV